MLLLIPFPYLIDHLFLVRGSRTEASKEKWHQLKGEFFLSSKPKRVVLYLEGPPAGVDLLVDSVLAFPSSHTQLEVCFTDLWMCVRFLY